MVGGGLRVPFSRDPGSPWFTCISPTTDGGERFSTCVLTVCVSLVKYLFPSFVRKVGLLAYFEFCKFFINLDLRPFIATGPPQSEASLLKSRLLPVLWCCFGAPSPALLGPWWGHGLRFGQGRSTLPYRCSHPSLCSRSRREGALQGRASFSVCPPPPEGEDGLGAMGAGPEESPRKPCPTAGVMSAAPPAALGVG